MNGDGNYYFEIKPKNAFTFGFRELLDYKELFFFFTWRDIKVKYKQTVMGFLWAILQPILLMLIFTFFIGRTFAIPSDGIEYSVFVFSGLILWLIFSSGIANAGNSMVTNAQIIKKIYFPRLIIPISAILVAVFDFLMAFIVFIPMLFFYNQPVDWLEALLWWPTGLLLTVIGTFGPGCLLAALNVKYRDFRYVIPFLVQVLLFVTPVIYPLSILTHKWLQYVVAINPMYAAITLFRLPLTSVSPDPVLISISVVSGLVIFILGLSYFRRTEMFFAELA